MTSTITLWLLIYFTQDIDAIEYNYTTIDFPGAIHTYAYGINGMGQFVGYYKDASDDNIGFLFDELSYETIDVPGSYWTVAEDINLNPA